MTTTMSEEQAWVRQFASQQRQGAQMRLAWDLDRLRLHAGLVRVVGRDEEVEIGTARMIPMGADEHGQNWCVLVVDV